MISLLSVIPIRGEAAESSEMVSQLLFGEEVEVLERADSWVRIKTVHDNYEGWVDAKMLSNKQQSMIPTVVVTSLTAILKSEGIFYPVLMGALLPRVEDSFFTLGNKEFELMDGKVALQALSADGALKLLFQLQNAPYLWGGRSSFGIDCSGLSQLYCRFRGQSIPRDASQQIALGDNVSLSEAQTGDLAFFEKNGRVTHVGVLIDNKNIIHASGQVRIDMIDDEGIYVKSEQRYSHKLIGVKRL